MKKLLAVAAAAVAALLPAAFTGCDRAEKPGTYTVGAELSCYIAAMGGIEFGKPLLQEAQYTLRDGGEMSVTLRFIKSSVTIYSITCYTFIDAAPDAVSEEGAVANGTIGYYDDAERFAFLSRAALEMLPYIDFKPDIIHCNDWQTALVPIYYSIFYANNDWYRGINELYGRREAKAYEILDLIGCSYDPHQAGLFVWGRLPEGDGDCYQFSDKILYNSGVFLTPGGIFGSEGQRYIRISLCATEETLQRSIDKIKQVL